MDPETNSYRIVYDLSVTTAGARNRTVVGDDHAEDSDWIVALSLIVNANLTRALYWARRYDEAIEQARRTLEFDQGFAVALFWLEGSLRHKGLFEEAVALRQTVAGPEQAEVIARTFQRSAALRRPADFRIVFRPVRSACSMSAIRSIPSRQASSTLASMQDRT